MGVPGVSEADWQLTLSLADCRSRQSPCPFQPLLGFINWVEFLTISVISEIVFFIYISLWNQIYGPKISYIAFLFLSEITRTIWKVTIPTSLLDFISTSGLDPRGFSISCHYGRSGFCCCHCCWGLHLDIVASESLPTAPQSDLHAAGSSWSLLGCVLALSFLSHGCFVIVLIKGLAC